MQRRLVVAGLMLGALSFHGLRCRAQRAPGPVPCPVCTAPAEFEKRTGVWLFWRCPHCRTATYHSDSEIRIEHVISWVGAD
jgi:hypothetical protein